MKTDLKFCGILENNPEAAAEDPLAHQNENVFYSDNDEIDSASEGSHAEEDSDNNNNTDREQDIDTDNAEGDNGGDSDFSRTGSVNSRESLGNVSSDENGYDEDNRRMDTDDGSVGGLSDGSQRNHSYQNSPDLSLRRGRRSKGVEREVHNRGTTNLRAPSAESSTSSHIASTSRSSEILVDPVDFFGSRNSDRSSQRRSSSVTIDPPLSERLTRRNVDEELSTRQRRSVVDQLDFEEEGEDTQVVVYNFCFIDNFDGFLYFFYMWKVDDEVVVLESEKRQLSPFNARESQAEIVMNVREIKIRQHHLLNRYRL